MKQARAKGFTLTELLTVIAVIAILASITALTVPRVLEKARIASVVGDFNSLRTSLAQYMATYGSYPPGYGYRRWESRDMNYADVLSGAINDGDYFNLLSYMTLIQQGKNFDLYDEFAEAFNTDLDDFLSPLEFSPAISMGLTDLYNFGEVSSGAVAQANDPRGTNRYVRPYIYIPVYRRHADKLKGFWDAGANNALDAVQGQTLSQSDYLTLFAALIALEVPPENFLTFPAPKYDAYVLISVGPMRSTNGIVGVPENIGDIVDNFGEENLYYFLALRAYYLATRDVNDNGVLDFEYRARTTEGEAKMVWPNTYRPNGTPLPLTTLPDGTDGFGPLIYVQK